MNQISHTMTWVLVSDHKVPYAIYTLISLTTKHKWKLHQLDVKFAFLNGGLKEEIYLV